jgi:hypothetical protein
MASNDGQWRWDGRQWQLAETNPAPEMGWWWDTDKRWHLVAPGVRWPRTAPQGWHWWPSGWSRTYDADGALHHWNWLGEPRQILVRNWLRPDPPPALEEWWDGGCWQLVAEEKPLPPYPPPGGWGRWWDGKRWQPMEGLPGPRRPAVDWGFIAAGTLFGGPLGALTTGAMTVVDQVRGRVR